MGSAAGAVFEASDGASLIVVGTRGHGRFARAFLGSTSRQVVRHASCPVVVVPPAI
jgi:nucleotide-binding universal stress UspA family protein